MTLGVRVVVVAFALTAFGSAAGQTPAKATVDVAVEDLVPGYQPVEVTMRFATPTPDDATYRLDTRPVTADGSGSGTTASVEFVVPAGSTQFDGRISVPVFQYHGGAVLAVFDPDGNRVTEGRHVAAQPTLSTAYGDDVTATIWDVASDSAVGGPSTYPGGPRLPPVARDRLPEACDVWRLNAEDLKALKATGERRERTLGDFRRRAMEGKVQVVGGIDPTSVASVLGVDLPTSPPIVFETINRPATPDADETIDAALGGGTVSIDPSADGSRRRWFEIAGPYVSDTLIRGVDPAHGDTRFNQWLVPGVAQPPVYTFMGMLGVFMAVVGPVAYVWTGRRKQRHLMFAIAPVAAAVTTALLFGYGFIADGFSTRTRIRQLTYLDGRSGDAFEHARATFFAGIRPSGGLRFPADARVYPYPDPVRYDAESEPPATRYLGRTMFRRIEHRRDGVRLSPDALPSREQRQFIVRRHRPGFGRVRLVSDAHGGLTIRNETDVRFDQLLVHVRKDVDYAAADVPAGGGVAAEPPRYVDKYGKPVAADARLSQWYSDFRPFDQSTRTVRRRTPREASLFTIDRMAEIVAAFEPATAYFEGTQERLLERWTRGGQMPDGSFVGIAEVEDDVRGVEGAVVVDSIRYVFGTYVDETAGEAPPAATALTRAATANTAPVGDGPGP